MLNLIIQDQERKVAVDTYFVSDSQETNKIFGFLNNAPQGELARYKKFEDAVRVFEDMVIAESRGLFIQLPNDDPKKIASFSALVKENPGECFRDKNG